MILKNDSKVYGKLKSTRKGGKLADCDRTVALSGNPNVGKSTVFNNLTGMKQHTGNWPGKTVGCAEGCCVTAKHKYRMVDLPGTYSLMAHSSEEEIARNFICFGEADAVVVVCDASCLERNLNLVLQTLEISTNVIVCVNLLDEAKHKGMRIDLQGLSRELGVPVVGTVARKKKSLDNLTKSIDALMEGGINAPLRISYPQQIEKAIAMLEPELKRMSGERINSRWLSLRLLDSDESLLNEISACFGEKFLQDEGLQKSLERARAYLYECGIKEDKLKDIVVSSLLFKAEEICAKILRYEKEEYNSFDRKMDGILTSKWAGYPVMLLLLSLVFYLTITGANYPSQWLASALFYLQDRLTELFVYLGAPDWLHGLVVLGAYRVLAWVVSVMLPPMAIFFPLFSLLEDAGYLPRVAYNLDRPFKRCCACGKQALTMCMGFGCNAVGVIGCRIIDSPRERLLAILTNNFVPCNGRFPTLIALLSMFFIGASAGAFSGLLSALLLTGVIVLGIGVTFAVTKLLSKTLLKGEASFFTLELPPYRRPQIGKVIVRSIFDRTLFVLGRAAAVAAPAGLLIWVMANIMIGDLSILDHCSAALDPIGRVMGLDGVILLAFILGFPANEIVVPIMIMAYLSQGSILELDNIAEMKALFIDNGWTWITAMCTMLFSLLHWPCSTTLLTIKKETGSWKWTAIAFALPTAIGFICCALFANIAKLFV